MPPLRTLVVRGAILGGALGLWFLKQTSDNGKGGSP
jgi:hypothetical protein